MSGIATRYRTVAAGFTARVVAVPPGAWEEPAPCDGWVARDVVGHLVEWLPAFFVATFDLDPPKIPAVADDPVGAWRALDGMIQTALDDPEVATRVRDTPMGSMTFEQAIDMIATTDVLIHTWDLARAAGLDETLDPDQVQGLLASMEPMDDALRSSGHYGPRVAIADDADEQSRLLAFLGRHP